MFLFNILVFINCYSCDTVFSHLCRIVVKKKKKNLINDLAQIKMK